LGADEGVGVVFILVLVLALSLVSSVAGGQAVVVIIVDIGYGSPFCVCNVGFVDGGWADDVLG